MLGWLCALFSPRPRRRSCGPSMEAPRDMGRDIAATDADVVSRRECMKVKMLFALFKRFLRLDRSRVRK